MTTIFRKFILGALIVALALAALPLTSAFAAGSNDPATPKDPAKVNARLELAFARQQMKVTRVGEAIANYNAMITNVQTLIDKAKEKGKDVSAVQAAFDAYKAAFVKGKPIYEQAAALVAKHDGFDVSGKVTDTEKAKATVKSLAESIKQYRDTVGEALKTLREAIKAFREANPRPTKTPKP
jgi:methyl-accepting chemotaxis protein